MIYIASILFAVSLSIDSLGIGSAYGMKNIKIPVMIRVALSMMSVIYTYLAILAGGLISNILPEYIGLIIGSLLLASIGAYMIISAFKREDEEPDDKPASKKPKRIARFFIDWLGISITIVRHPAYGDLDGSKSIDLKEAVYLGLALSFDAIGAGVGFGMTNALTYIMPVMAGIFQFLFLSCGIYFGTRLRKVRFLNEKTLAVMAGILIIAIAGLRFII